MGIHSCRYQFTNILTVASLDATKVILFDASSGSLAALDYLKQDLQQLVEPSTSLVPLTKTGSFPNVCAFLSGSLLQLLTVTYEENLSGTRILAYG
jgi:hypothetical protein